MAPPRKWPKRASELQDRTRVIRAARLAGEKALTFTVYDVRREIDANPKLGLAHSGQLARHLNDLTGDLIEYVGKRLSSPNRPVHKARRKYVLTSRLHEYNETGPAADTLDDLERVYLAVWVAHTTAESGPVPTRAITEVLRHIPTLALSVPRQTFTHLQTLAKSRPARVRKERVEGSRWVRWIPLGRAPSGGDFDRWVELMKAARESDLDLVRSGHATLNEVVRRLVTIAIQRSRNRSLPSGRPARAEDIKAVGAEEDEARELWELLDRRGVKIGALLGDATKDRVAGNARVDYPLIKVPARGSVTYYDVPGLPGGEARRTWVDWKDLKNDLSPSDFERLHFEWSLARKHSRSSEEGVDLIGMVRLVLLGQELDEIDERIQALAGGVGRLSTQTQKAFKKTRADFAAFRGSHGASDALIAETVARLAKMGIALQAIKARPRPLLTPHQYSRWFPESSLKDRSDAEFLHLASSLRRFPNPRFTNRWDEDPDNRAPLAVDRVEALLHAAGIHQSKLLGFLHAGHSLLGRNLRDPRIFRPLVERSGRQPDGAALSALALLGDPVAVEWAAKTLRDTSTDSSQLRTAVYALCVTRSVPPDELRRLLLERGDRAGRDLMLETVPALVHGRWLLQRRAG